LYLLFKRRHIRVGLPGEDNLFDPSTFITMISAADFSSEQQGKVTNLPPITKAPQRQVACVVCGQYFFKPQLPIHQRGYK
jgi:hypothetical protein